MCVAHFTNCVCVCACVCARARALGVLEYVLLHATYVKHLLSEQSLPLQVVCGLQQHLWCLPTALGCGGGAQLLSDPSGHLGQWHGSGDKQGETTAALNPCMGHMSIAFSHDNPFNVSFI